MKIDIVTIFPEYFGPLELSLIGRARATGRLGVTVHDLRTWTHDVHRTVDDTPYGGGPGMVMRPEPWGEALDALTGSPRPAGPPGSAGSPRPAGSPDFPGDRDGPGELDGEAGPVASSPATGPPATVPPRLAVPPATVSPRLVVPPATVPPRLVVPTPAGRLFNQALAAELAGELHLIFACGRYEGIDQRVLDHAGARMPVTEVSIGDYVLFGGEVAVLVILEAVVRLLPGVLGNADSLVEESHAAGLLEAPVYTKPAVWRGHPVPEILRSGDHARIARWRRSQALLRTARRRPDLLGTAAGPELDREDRAVLATAGFQLSPPDVAK